jgi:prepilin-type N-terminal cleavage/methylation domain-containing protein
MPRTQRRGFTVIELLVVLLIVSTLAAIGIPKMSTAMGRSSLRSARQQVQSTVVLARAAAIQNGRPARLVRNGNVVQAMLENGAQLVAVGAPVDVSDARVRIEMAVDTIRFDPRGFAPGLPGTSSYLLIRLYRGAAGDTLCVSRFGRIGSRGSCQ